MDENVHATEAPVETRFTFLGHPVHPMLIVYPLGLLSAALVFDVLYVATDNGDLATFSFWALAAGLVGGATALVTAWLGGELVYRLRVAVDDDAGLDASNSLAQDGVADASAR